MRRLLICIRCAQVCLVDSAVCAGCGALLCPLCDQEAPLCAQCAARAALARLGALLHVERSPSASPEAPCSSRP